MRIAQVSPLYESVPPRQYGGTERIVSYLTEELVRRGHHVTLFASGDSRTSAHLIPMCKKHLRHTDPRDKLCQHIYMIERVARRAFDYDLIHWHLDYLHFPVARRLQTPHLTTLHGRLDLPELTQLFDEYGDMPVVSLSQAQRAHLPQAWWFGNVPHGLPKDAYALREERGEYLAFLGRLSPEKRPDRAIEIARAVNMPLKIAAKVDAADRDYVRSLEPLLDDPLVEYLGEIGDDRKAELLGGAAALLFPIDWQEPFGLVMLEAMACGTPVVAFRHGSVAEIVEHERTGFVVDDMESAIECTRRVSQLERRTIRNVFEERFSVERMVSEYLSLYENLCYTPALSKPARTRADAGEATMDMSRA